VIKLGGNARHPFAISAAVGLLLTSAIAIAWQAGTVIPHLIGQRDFLRVAEASVLFSVFGWSLFGVAVAIIAEIGVELRNARCGEQTNADYRSFHRREANSDLLVLIPSFREEAETIWQSLMSAALAEHPNRHVVLLIDDPTLPSTAAQAKLLADARALSGQLQTLFDRAAAPFAQARSCFIARRAYALDHAKELQILARLYGEAADWLDRQAGFFRARRVGNETHTDRLFAERILEAPAEELCRRAGALSKDCRNIRDLEAEYDRLAALFRVRFSSFERKRYANLSHEPNKAMNLNSYLSLIGGAFREESSEQGAVLIPCPRGEATLVVPDYQFVMTIDADSLITHDCNVHLLEVMNRLGGDKVAVAQSPYTAILGASAAIEKAAARSTDGQFFSHQGLALLGAASWVGASALMRVSALRDIMTTRSERGYRIEVFVKDDILIEDAAATIDLLRQGWRIHHDRRRLSYSATPPDFGALVIQRRRWANGGLLLLPRLFAVALRRPWSPRRISDALLRVPNLTSAATNGLYFGLFLLIPFDDELVPPWMAVVLLPSVLVTGLGLVRAGYRLVDLVAVQTLSLLLVPVNLAGTFQSLRQAFTGRPIPFARTPKIGDRTRTPRAYIFAVYGLIAYGAGRGIVDVHLGLLNHAAFAIVNAGVFLYCLVRYLGLLHSLEDAGLRIRLLPRLRLGVARMRLSLLFRRARQPLTGSEGKTQWL
jgi:cellulose synthase/poly-beta-1,6-N-acetylglucosamine synthase-like glycosyltransferase